jgi:pimeloyl-ACP methyl ester carboxylesterase
VSPQLTPAQRRYDGLMRSPPDEGLAEIRLRWVRLADHETLVARSGETGPAVVLLHAPGTPHMQTLERPELVAAALNEFLPAGALDKVET